MAVIAEFYNGGRHAKYASMLARHTTIPIMEVEQHRAMLTDAGFADVLVDKEGGRGWIGVADAKP